MFISVYDIPVFDIWFLEYIYVLPDMLMYVYVSTCNFHGDMFVFTSIVLVLLSICICSHQGFTLVKLLNTLHRQVLYHWSMRFFIVRVYALLNNYVVFLSD